ncbi:hypothetical protein ACFOW6_00180 [Fodinicurvata halophila]|uniref:Uncharacterized protein n=1 Tax=Fodinicurvata halophila TaxID=1419723 RepID=A0ABV8UH37_9PROT
MAQLQACGVEQAAQHLPEAELGRTGLKVECEAQQQRQGEQQQRHATPLSDLAKTVVKRV